LDRNSTYSFSTAPAVSHNPGLIAGARHRWRHVDVAVANPPSSHQVLERLSDLLTPPLSHAMPTKAQIRSGAYDSLGAHCLTQSHRPAESIMWAYNACTNVIREHSKSFYFSARLLPHGKRHGIMALYAFCRLSDDLVDEADAGVDINTARWQAEQALSEWARTNRSPGTGATDPVVVAWADTRSRCLIPEGLADDLIEGVRMDLTIDRYDTWNELWLYCYRVASTVGLMSMYITGADTMDAVPYAVQLGVALQLTNILRDVGEDARAGRIYLPREDMARFGYTEEMLLSGTINRQYMDLMQFEIARAHALYDAARPGIAMLPADSRMAVATAATVYRGILHKIAQNNYDVFVRRAHLSATEKIRALPALWWKLRTGQ
jgi:15-cis-phytoene synthase